LQIPFGLIADSRLDYSYFKPVINQQSAKTERKDREKDSCSFAFTEESLFDVGDVQGRILGVSPESGTG
jgi:hypothetical protein